ncbi:MAG TPA: hypothetical protein PLJ47_00960 [Candidatus Hydrogenedentes bacterium]|nr:hypothetical protein [Candidatus Hydrogenedentota bacterium]HRK33133.1 hypothetical protein [Candidatus Hydrogenedentota bacterium]
MAAKAKSTRKRGKRRSEEQVQQLLGQLESLRNSGEPLMKALSKLGISYSNYNYWLKKIGGGKKTGKRGRPAGGAKGVLGLLDEMKANRAERDQHEKAISALDAKFSQLKKRLGSN